MNRCPDCGERSPDAASFCIVCGACLRPPAALPSVRIRATTGQTIRLTPTASVSHAAAPLCSGAGAARAHTGLGPSLIATIGLLFGTVFVVEFAQLLALAELSLVGLVPAVLPLVGALLAEQAWVNGDLWRGLRGMLLWGGLAWLLGNGGVVPWALLLLLAWAALHPRWYSWYPYRQGRHV